MTMTWSMEYHGNIKRVRVVGFKKEASTMVASAPRPSCHPWLEANGRDQETKFRFLQERQGSPSKERNQSNRLACLLARKKPDETNEKHTIDVERGRMTLTCGVDGLCLRIVVSTTTRKATRTRGGGARRKAVAALLLPLLHCKEQIGLLSH